jgi:hypothetical protein
VALYFWKPQIQIVAALYRWIWKDEISRNARKGRLKRLAEKGILSYTIHCNVTYWVKLERNSIGVSYVTYGAFFFETRYGAFFH